jgi:hypothetical protein
MWAFPRTVFFPPSDNQVATFLKLFRDNPGRKIFVHCYFGDDRTGVMVASYRMAEQHWTTDQAYNEMRAFHFHRLFSSWAATSSFPPRTSRGARLSRHSAAPDPGIEFCGILLAFSNQYFRTVFHGTIGSFLGRVDPAKLIAEAGGLTG